MGKVINIQVHKIQESVSVLLSTSPIKILIDEMPERAVRKSWNGRILKKFLELMYRYLDKDNFGGKWVDTAAELQRYGNWFNMNEVIQGVNTYEEVMRIIRKYMPWIISE